MNSIEIRKISITDTDADAVVNAANEQLKAGGGVCGAIFAAAGREELQEACDRIGHCRTGSAVITPGFGMKAKYIIHAVGPVWKGGRHGEARHLYRAYCKALELAEENGCGSVAFPLISAGIYGYPVREAWREALRACGYFLDRHKNGSLRIIFAVLDDGILETGREILREGAADGYRIADRGDREVLDMPEEHDVFIFRRPLTEKQTEILRKGHVPQGMEDKWFWFMEGDTLYACRSWTGCCIYRVDLKPDGAHTVTVNRDPEQYLCSSVEEDAEKLNELLNLWTQDGFEDYEWHPDPEREKEKTERTFERLRISGQETDAVFFHSPEEADGFLSNWYLSPFDLDGLHFSSAEQYIMYRKCMTFGDQATAEKIMATENTAEQQNLGRKASGFVDTVWAGMRQMTALRALMAKFGQNEYLKKKLFETRDAVLVECSGKDRVWACGVRLADDDRLDAGKWQGDNILGFALMEVRRLLREQTDI